MAEDNDFDTNKWMQWLKTMKRRSNDDISTAVTLILEEMTRKTENEKSKDNLDGLKILKLAGVEFPEEETRIFRQRMKLQMPLCRFDDNEYESDYNRWRSLLLTDLSQGICPVEIGVWDFLFLKVDPVIVKQAALLYNPPDESAVVRMYPKHQVMKKRFRIGLLAGAWMCHTTTYLVRALLRCLDRRIFTVYALVSLCQKDPHDTCREDISKLCNLVNLPDLDVSHEEAAAAIKNLDLDFLIDLIGPGYATKGGAFSHRPSKIQINWLAHPGTCGNSGLHYIIVDSVVAPIHSSKDWFTEKRAMMNKTYFVGDHEEMFPHLKEELRIKTSDGKTIVLHSSDPIPAFFKIAKFADEIQSMLLGGQNADYLMIRNHKIWDGSCLPDRVRQGYRKLDGMVATSRAQFGLSENSFIFANWNGHLKHDMETFDMWLEILKAVPNSLYWMSPYPSSAESGLRSRMRQKGLDDARLVLLPGFFESKELHIRRGSLVDLYLDPIICNGHTTSMDAIYAGAPVLCMEGEDLQSRVTASMNHVLQLTVLITRTREDYKERAIFFGLHVDMLDYLRGELLKRKRTSPLFDARQFAFDFENILKRMYEEFILHPNAPELWRDLFPTEKPSDWQYFSDIDMNKLQNIFGATNNASSGLDPIENVEILTRASTFDRMQLPFFVWLENAVKFCLEAHLGDFAHLYIGPVQAAQFIHRIMCYLSAGVPILPRDAEDYYAGFFTSTKGLLHIDSYQYSITRSMIGQDGIMMEPDAQNKNFYEMTKTDFKQKHCCLLCDFGKDVPKGCTTLRDTHGPDVHTWKGRTQRPKDCPQCDRCGLPLVLLDTQEALRRHSSLHDAIDSLDVHEVYFPNPNKEPTGDWIEFHPFKVNIADAPGTLQTLHSEIERYNNEAKNTAYGKLLLSGNWVYQEGQTMLSYIWLKNSVSQTLEWMKENVGKVAASHTVGQQFLKILQVNLNTMGCPVMPNLNSLTQELRSKFCKTNFKFPDTESYELLFRIFTDTDGKIKESQWLSHAAIPEEESYCKLCHEALPKVSKKNLRAALNNHHLLKDVAVDATNPTTCPGCGFLFSSTYQNMDSIRGEHQQLHSQIVAWEETIVRINTNGTEEEMKYQIF